MPVQQRHCALDLAVAFGELAAAEVERRQRLLEREQVLVAPVAEQAGGDLGLAGVDARVTVGGQRVRVALAGNNGTYDLLTRGTGHIADDVGELDVHQRHRLLHVLHRAALVAQQPGALASEGAQRAHLLGRAKRAAQQPEGEQLLQPLAVEHIGLAARDILHVPGVDQQDFEAAALEHLVQRDPVDPGGLHRHDLHAALLEPVGHGVQIAGEAVELANGLVGGVGANGRVVRAPAYVDACGVRVRDLQPAAAKGSVALCHKVLHHSLWNVALAAGTSSCSLFQTGYRSSGKHRHCDSPMSMTSPRTNLTRGHCAPVAFRSSPVPHSTLPQRKSTVFLRRDLRHLADWAPNQSFERTCPRRLRRLAPAAQLQRWAPGSSTSASRTI